MTQGKIYRADYSTTNDARVHQTRASIRKAFLKLLKKKPMEQITIREIAAEAAIGYTTFFRHHQSKEDLLNEIAAAEISHLIELALPTLGAVDAREATLAMCHYIAKHRVLWATLLTGGAANSLRDEFIRLSLQVAASWKTNDTWLPPEVGVILVTSGTIELLAWWLRQKNPIPVEKLAAILDKTVISPVIHSQENN